jgi:cytochrome P450
MLVKYWKKCKTSKLPLIGNLHQLNGGPLPHHGTTELSKKYGPAMQLQVGEKFAVVVSSPEAAKEVFKDKRTQFCSKTCSSGS